MITTPNEEMVMKKVGGRERKGKGQRGQVRLEKNAV
jgi:hypothetical protein